MLEKKSTRIRKEEIVRATLEVIGKGGVRALTIAAIADSAGMSEANIYRHFGGKDEIFFALADFIGTSVMGKAATIAAGSKKPLEKLEIIFFSHISIVATYPGIPRFMFSEDTHLGNPDLAKKLAMRIGNYVETLSGVIAAGIDEGELKQGLSPRETALTFLGMIQFTALRWTINGTSFDIRGEAQKLWGNFLHLAR
ncbi:TetR/AcrR family transcriptional regulator [Oryzomonas japonica]|uniref:TetR/AcrR family transcriptional regulator n=1 Tax=Oryzomonas japonica TaxID=2603858 RepID=A0A7J4ZW62_9BACT|nr:TetR/AcrR family transcriptional regulator [Oryzomonas japonica]KAB0667709.1 TetR/AcrR family transcriptional regulator [Oryzomonas japonica]